MTPDSDLLYSIFEHHLYNALVEEESTAEFLTRVVDDYLDHLKTKAMIPRPYSDSIVADLKDEVLEMLRKKIYGHYNLDAFRKAKGILPATKDPAPPSKRRGS